MKYPFPFLIILLAACTQTTEQAQMLTNKPTVGIIPSEIGYPVFDTILPDPLSWFEEDKDLMQDFECARGIPQPVLDSSLFPGRKFFLTDENEGVEKAILKNGDEVTITQSGCEYFLLTFQFETKQPHPKDSHDLHYWADCCAKLLHELDDNAHVNFDMEKGLDALLRFYSDKKTEQSLGEEIDFGGEEIRSFVSMDNVQRLNEKEYQVIVTFGVGPL